MGKTSERNEGSSNNAVDVKILSDDSLVTSLEDELENLSSLCTKCSIFRVPVPLRERNEKAFTPREISIGPPLHNNENLKHMQQHKLRLLKKFLSRAMLSLHDFVQLLREKEVYLRNCYADPIEFDSDKFIEIILVDSAFILELFFINFSSDHKKQLQDRYDHCFGGPWKLRFINTDMLLLENQVPFLIIEDLLSLTKSGILPMKNSVRLSAIELTYQFFKRKLNLSDMNHLNIVEKVGGLQIQHFVDFARICYVPPECPCNNKLKGMSMPRATKLREAGVKFKVMNKGNPFDIIRFKDGVLEISRLRLKDETEILLRNLIAYERCHLHDHYMIDYVFILDRLVDTEDDVELLMHYGIIESKLSGTQEVASTINRLSPGTTMARSFYFSDLCENVDHYYRVPWNKWRVTLKDDYFKNPWSVISVIAATVLLLLTILQTYYAMMSYYFK